MLVLFGKINRLTPLSTLSGGLASRHKAVIAQQVERLPSKQNVAGSIPVSRSRIMRMAQKDPEVGWSRLGG